MKGEKARKDPGMGMDGEKDGKDLRLEMVVGKVDGGGEGSGTVDGGEGDWG